MNKKLLTGIIFQGLQFIIALAVLITSAISNLSFNITQQGLTTFVLIMMIAGGNLLSIVLIVTGVKDKDD